MHSSARDFADKRGILWLLDLLKLEQVCFEGLCNVQAACPQDTSIEHFHAPESYVGMFTATSVQPWQVKAVFAATEMINDNVSTILASMWPSQAVRWEDHRRSHVDVGPAHC